MDLDGKRPEETPPPRAGAVLLLWIALTLILQAALWVSGARETSVEEAIERGAAKAESRGIGEVEDEAVRKAIALQHDTRAFWTVLALIGDFLVEPMLFPVRAGLAAALFAAIALMRGRPAPFAQGFASCAWSQGFWVLGLAVRATLAIFLRRPEIETSPTLLLGPGVYAGAAWVALRQLDVFAILGWWGMFRSGVRTMRVGWLPAGAVCLLLFLTEALLRLQASLVIEAGMRLTLIPERF